MMRSAPESRMLAPHLLVVQSRIRPTTAMTIKRYGQYERMRSNFIAVGARGSAQDHSAYPVEQQSDSGSYSRAKQNFRVVSIPPPFPESNQPQYLSGQKLPHLGATR